MLVLHVVAARAHGPRAMVAAGALALLVVAGTPSQAAGSPVAPAAPEQAADDDGATPSGGDNGPSIIHKPTDEAGRPSNDLGFLVGLGLLMAWIASGVIMFGRARRRTAARRSSPVDADDRPGPGEGARKSDASEVGAADA